MFEQIIIPLFHFIRFLFLLNFSLQIFFMLLVILQVFQQKIISMSGIIFHTIRLILYIFLEDLI